MFFRNRVTLAIIVAALITGVLIFVTNRISPEQPASILKEYEDKIVYTVDLSQNKDLLIEDCNVRGGTFNNCGSPCGPDEEVCIDVCAYTCENINK